MRKRTGTPQLMKAMNRALVIDALTKHGPISQTQICEVTGLSRATVSTVVHELKTDQLVMEVRKGISKGGRRQVLLELDATAGFVVGVDLGGTKMAGAVTDLRGHPIVKLRWPTGAVKGPEAVVETLVQFIQQLIQQSGIECSRLRGIGVGVPGIVRPGGMVEWAPALQWRGLAIASILKDRLHYPVFVENDVNLLALGEYWYGAGQGAQSLACLAVGTGVGAGIVINGQLYSGAHQAAGEVCNLVVDRSPLGRDFSQFGCLESIASGPALAKRYADQRREPTATGYGDTIAAGGARLDDGTVTGAEIVFDEARKGDPIAKRIVDEFAQALAMAVISIITVLDPEVIVLGGGVSQDADLFLGRLNELCRPAVQVMPKLVVSSLGVDAGVMGAVALTLHKTKEDPLQ